MVIAKISADLIIDPVFHSSCTGFAPAVFRGSPGRRSVKRQPSFQRNAAPVAECSAARADCDGLPARWTAAV
jgi:hypothetical protein